MGALDSERWEYPKIPTNTSTSFNEIQTNDHQYKDINMGTNSYLVQQFCYFDWRYIYHEHKDIPTIHKAGLKFYYH